MTTEEKIAELLKAKNDDEIRAVIEKLTDLQKNAVIFALVKTMLPPQL